MNRTSTSGRPRQFNGDRLVLASHNRGKISEFEELFAPRNIKIISAGDLDLPEPDETGKSYAENAILKAELAAVGAGLPALADDSGISVTALGGDPGIYSARWAGPGKDFGHAMQLVEDRLAGISDRSATFVCALSLAWPDGIAETVEGYVSGQVVWPPRGNHGFGYDPMFVPDGYERTFGEMTPQEKNPLTHRAAAFKKMMTRCFTENERT